MLYLSACLASSNQNSSVTNEDDLASYDDIDFKDCFENIKGCAVILDKENDKYYFHNEKMTHVMVSPYSTFKIMAALIGLHNGIVKNEYSKMKYSGVEYPLNAWNDDLSLEQAFKSSCVWYFRQVINAVGRDEVKKELRDMVYGNCNISEWDGSDANPMFDLNGFWIDSSLRISPFEQVSVLRKIFEGQSIYSLDDIKILKNIMLVEDNGINKIYGKTGSASDGKAWFVGFEERGPNRIYFAVYLDDPKKQKDVNGNKAREIALKIITKIHDIKQTKS